LTLYYNSAVPAFALRASAWQAKSACGATHALQRTEVAVKLIGVLLIVFGVVALVIGGIRYTTRETVVDVGPIHATADKHHEIPLSPIVGLASIAGGIALVAVGGRTRV
jgi:uncharacterized membrane protein YidH (DUF202 family)